MKNRLTLWLFFIDSFLSILGAGFGKKIVLLGAPYHWNLGDHAQTYCTLEWMKHNYPNKKTLVLDTRSATKFNFILIRLLKFFKSKEDIYLLHSGYHLTDLYPLEFDLILKVVHDFKESKIVILPQTINFTNKESETLVVSLFSKASDLLVLCRDETSYSLAQKIFTCKLLLYPDIVTTMIGQNNHGKSTREGINLCLRNDKESLYRQNGQDKKIIEELSKIDHTEVTDTEAKENPYIVKRKLKDILVRSWSDFGDYKVTVTDRYHGTIFSLVAGTPVVVISSTDHKLISGVKWFPPKLFKDYVYYAESAEAAIELVQGIYKKNLNYTLPDYFNPTYYSKLKSEIENS